jgi:polyhydroxyalkanoate synthesis regulator phasin
MADTTNVVVAGQREQNRSYVDWPAIIAGSVLASAIFWILMTFGSALGLGSFSPYTGAPPGLMAAILAAVWVVFVIVGSYMAGGYLTGRMRHRFHDATERESDARDGMHGVIMWGLTILISLVLTAGTLSSVLKTGANAAALGAGAAAGGAAAAGGGQQGGGTGAFDLVTDAMFRASPNATPPATPPQGGPTRAETRDEVDRILARGVARGEITKEDRTYIAQLVSRETGIPQQEAEQRINTVIDKTVEDAKKAADVARKTAIMVACLLATTLMVAGAGSYFAAVRGGDHRDNNRDLGPMWY